METIKHLPFIASAKTTILLDIATNLDKNFVMAERKSLLPCLSIFFIKVLHCKKAHGIIFCHGSVSCVKRKFSLYGWSVKIPCIYGNNHFHASYNFHILCYHYLPMTSMDPKNDFHGCRNYFHRSLELLLRVHGMIFMGTWKYFLGSMEKIQRAIGHHFTH